MWGLAFGNGANGSDSNSLYFTAGIGGEQHGRAAGQPGEGPNHFLDMDAFGAFPFPDIPRSGNATFSSALRCGKRAYSWNR